MADKDKEIRPGNQMSEEELKASEQAWKDMEDCFNNLEVLEEEEDNE